MFADWSEIDSGYHMKSQEIWLKSRPKYVWHFLRMKLAWVDGIAYVDEKKCTKQTSNKIPFQVFLVIWTLPYEWNNWNIFLQSLQINIGQYASLAGTDLFFSSEKSFFFFLWGVFFLATI
jgi:hypothetical protein